MLAYLHGTGDAVFMESVSPVSTGKIGAVDSVYFRVTVSGRQTFRVVYRMVINICAVDFGRINGFGQIQRNA